MHLCCYFFFFDNYLCCYFTFVKLCLGVSVLIINKYYFDYLYVDGICKSFYVPSKFNRRNKIMSAKYNTNNIHTLNIE